ncbi:hypothetical protein [Desulfonatronum sp. SC1]|uniref:hypothetical protein n=1 Tax=Desulfonatronum sp. SC1 TaxID=2109626 RepID=UPI000D3260A2|nr:hypothetical protein [Desulfonatronum sp. SC1]PTN36524.1 hypothetical protein C6366_09375 [Desulfonatronum sp. SC1]
MSSNDIIHAFDAQGKPLGVFIPFALWEQLDQKTRNALERPTAKFQEIKEPIGDWEMLVSCWDFPYPVDTDVHCRLCDNQTQDWQQDNPRKFLLKAANLGGLVSFECAQCQARIRKNHFKDAIDVNCTQPFSG